MLDLEVVGPPIQVPNCNSCVLLCGVAYGLATVLVCSAHAAALRAPFKLLSGIGMIYLNGTQHPCK